MIFCESRVPGQEGSCLNEILAPQLVRTINVENNYIQKHEPINKQFVKFCTKTVHVVSDPVCQEAVVYQER